MTSKFAMGWKLYQTQKREETIKGLDKYSDGYCYPNTMIESYDVEREKELTN